MTEFSELELMTVRISKIIPSREGLIVTQGCNTATITASDLSFAADAFDGTSLEIVQVKGVWLTRTQVDQLLQIPYPRRSH